MGSIPTKTLVKKIDDLIEKEEYASRADILRSVMREKLKISGDSDFRKKPTVLVD